jgi:hypothetical protein
MMRMMSPLIPVDIYIVNLAIKTCVLGGIVGIQTDGK